MLNYKIFKNQSVIFNPIIYDPVNNELSTFISPNILKVFPNLNEYFKDAEGSKCYNQRFIATSLSQNPFFKDFSI